ncbi:hypothetical protein A2524_00370 [Candidatus Wolfebacteria bacterium RIFOXYD12_FULL_48_21]|nr:MAG: hypothetical protein A2524_00370 [Candidatus Wolfebacteria bacterium RIFOXYD12_FULL_48_21]OGM96520.1 MAG: hypothetical protein A2532_02220 [Candidatus Wolfebacteria bacterium RIFOXYD2_FULL_48_11]
MSIKTKVIIGVVVTTACFGVLMAITATRVADRVITDIVLKHTAMVVTQQRDVIEGVFADSIGFARNISLQQPIITYLQLSDPQEQDPTLLAHLTNSDANKHYQAVYVMDKAGKTLVSTDPSFVGQNYAFRTYFKGAISGASTVDAAIGVTSGKFGYYFSHPVKAPSGEIVGIVVAKLKEDLITDALRPDDLSAEGNAILVDKYGVVIQAKKRNLLFKSLGKLPPNVLREITEEKRFGGIDIQAMHYDEVAREIAGLGESREFIVYDQMHARDELVGMARIPNTPFFIVITELRQFFTEAADKAVLGMGIFIFVASLGMGIVVTMLLLLVVRPLRALRDSLLQTVKGIGAQPHIIKTSDEFEDISATLAAAMNQIKKAHGAMENKLWERAADFEKFKLAVESASDHIIITDIDGHILYANKAAEATTGYSRNEMIGNRPSLWGRQMKKEFYETMWSTIKEQRQPFHAEVTNRRKNGEIYESDMHIAPLLTDKGDARGFVGIERDITAQKNADRAKTDFVSIASHQLRTPLAAINWYVEMLSDEDVGPINAIQRKYLDQIHVASARMVELVSSLLSVSRIDTGSLHSEPAPALLSDIADSVMDELSQFAEKRRISVNKEYAKNMGTINVDPNMMRVVLQNLLSNALKYTPEKGSVTVSIKKVYGQAVITVSDTGYGIPANQQSQIFTKFFRADNARKKEPEGNGLGLYITKSIIDHVRGTIGFVSTEGKGSTFRITLPLPGEVAKTNRKDRA